MINAKVCYVGSSISILVTNFCPSCLEGRGNTFTNLCPAFRQIGRGRGLSLYLLFLKIAFHQNNLYVKMVYLGEAYFATLHTPYFSFLYLQLAFVKSLFSFNQF